ncbi:M23 family metallopeptidase [Akkermansiaceae bacterium]|nr:M23 family metallopeptidase [Akkermansiaceae bacterium]
MAKRVADWRLPYHAKYITSHYGEMSAFRKANGMQPHSGTDWARPRGTRIPAIAKGTIRLIQFSKVLGWVVVQTAMDKNGKVWYLGYCHMDSKPGYSVGQKIRKGQTIGKVASTGQSSGPHLHATASRTLKGVFGVTSAKVDLYKLILANTKRAPAQAAQPAKSSGVCQCCKRAY